MKNLKNLITVECVGIDNNIHICEPHLSVAICGCKVKSKKQSTIEKAKIDGVFSCYECTY